MKFENVMGLHISGSVVNETISTMPKTNIASVLYTTIAILLAVDQAASKLDCEDWKDGWSEDTAKKIKCSDKGIKIVC